MRLLEYEAKALIASYGVSVPQGFQCGRDAVSTAFAASVSLPAVLKAQLSMGGRMKKGSVIFADTSFHVHDGLVRLFGGPLNGDHDALVRIEEKLPIEHEYYAACMYESWKRVPVLLFSTHGGIDIELATAMRPDQLIRIPLTADGPFPYHKVLQVCMRSGMSEDDAVSFSHTLDSLTRCFFEEDALFVEVNPFIKAKNATWIALDAKITLDDHARYRHANWAGYRSRNVFGGSLSKREEKIRSIDTNDMYWRGTVGSYLDLSGDIAVLFSGGGASLACMDALVAAGGAPANYAEYSGNPPREKVAALAETVLSKPGIHGLWIAGGVANFTRIDETLGGIADALRYIRPTYPIVVRRAGPGDASGRAMLERTAKELGLDLHYFDRETSLTETARMIVDRAAAYKKEHHM